MIYDSIENLNDYLVGNEAWEKVCEFIKTITPDMECGRCEIDGDNIYANVQNYKTKLLEDGLIEAHHKYIDIQLLAAGQEDVYVFDIANMVTDEPYDKDRDVEFYKKPVTAGECMTLTPGKFLLLNPEDGHMPCIAHGGQSNVAKVVIKIAADLLK